MCLPEERRRRDEEQNGETGGDLRALIHTEIGCLDGDDGSSLVYHLDATGQRSKGSVPLVKTKVIHATTNRTMGQYKRQKPIPNLLIVYTTFSSLMPRLESTLSFSLNFRFADEMRPTAIALFLRMNLCVCECV